MAHRDIVADRRVQAPALRIVLRHVDDRSVLNVRSLADTYLVDIPPEHAVVPNVRTIPDFHVTLIVLAVFGKVVQQLGVVVLDVMLPVLVCAQAQMISLYHQALTTVK